MQRIRIGLTGLGVVFLLVLLGAAISRSGDDGTANVAAVNTGEPNEPLAELGVAPGSNEQEAVERNLP
uniref:hypothetical protein n=1 Tax=uncultured Sphingomonas sp. TaxID=158754 RepID=UPI0025E625C2|nr:hypothetical protein [uncultured Sphingomonas sp.]